MNKKFLFLIMFIGLSIAFWSFVNKESDYDVSGKIKNIEFNEEGTVFLVQVRTNLLSKYRNPDIIVDTQTEILLNRTELLPNQTELNYLKVEKDKLIGKKINVITRDVRTLSDPPRMRAIKIEIN